MSIPDDSVQATGPEEEEDFESLSVILARDLIFMDWMVNFGGQMLGIVLAILLGFIFLSL